MLPHSEHNGASHTAQDLLRPELLFPRHGQLNTRRAGYDLAIAGRKKLDTATGIPYYHEIGI